MTPTAYKPFLRKRHNKVRTGCLMCKRRKIKCDESRPICANCTKRGYECKFHATHSAPQHQFNTSPVDAAAMHISPFPDNRGHTPLPMNSIHLELLHNYTTLTSHTLSSDCTLRSIWRISVPQVGFSYDFVMRSILALSALHMARRLSTSRQDFYLQLAQSEHGAALQQITRILPHVTASNCSAVYIAAVLTFFYAWAAPRQPDDFFLVSGSGIAEWLFLLQGVRSIRHSWHAELERGPFSAMFRIGGSRVERHAASYLATTAWQSTSEHTQLTTLRRIVARAAADGNVAVVFKRSIDNLEASYCATLLRTSSERDNNWNSELSDTAPEVDTTVLPLTASIYSWIYKLDESFIEMLSKRSPLALAIFAHFCVLLHFLDGYWWMKGWSTHLLQEIWANLDQEHRIWIRWPIEEIGGLPGIS